MRYTRWAFFGAAVFGLALLIPLAPGALGGWQDIAPADGPYGVYFVGSVIQHIVWQIVYLMIFSDPYRFRPMMVPATLAMATSPFVSVWLYVYGVGVWNYIALLYGAFAILFILALWQSGKGRQPAAT
jgi:hypothetical protein